MLTLLLKELTDGLTETLDVPGGLFRLVYCLRNPAPGRGTGLDGVEDADLIKRYADALARTHCVFREWGWPEPRRATDAEWGWPEPHRDDDAGGYVQVYVFCTAWLTQVDAPLTITNPIDPQVYASRIGLRSTSDEPRPDVRGKRAEVEAAHEAAHTYTHQFVAPTEAIGKLWAWFDEATAVFVEGELYPGHHESRRYGLYWSHCPEVPLDAWGGFGGYFAAWFVRFLVHRFDPGLLLAVWSGSEGRFGPFEVLNRLLPPRGANFPDVFWEYCWRGYDPGEIAPGVAESFGPRSLTETFTAPTGGGVAAPLHPLACRYYRILWDGDVTSTPVRVETDGPVAAGELRTIVLSVAADGKILDQAAFSAADTAGRCWRGTARRPDPAGAHTAVVVARVLPPREQRPEAVKPVDVRVLIGA